MHHLRRQQYLGDGFPLLVEEACHRAPIAQHTHDFFEIVYVRGGTGVHVLEGTTYPVRTGDLYVVSPGENHAYAPDEGGSVRIVNVLWMPDLVQDLLRAERPSQSSGQLYEKLGYVDPILSGETVFNRRLHLPAGSAVRVDNLLHEMQREQMRNAPGCRLLLRHLFCALLVLLSRASSEAEPPPHDSASAHPAPPAHSPQQALVVRALDYIETHYREPLRVAELARHLAMSPSRLAHIFKQHTQRGINAYLHEVRLNHACAALRHGDLSVRAVATAAGYHDLRFFQRIFLRHTGCTPTAYRRRFAHSTGAV